MVSLSEVTKKIPGNITIVAVTKAFPIEVVREALRLGIRHFGENRLEEASGKIPLIKDDTVWHMIGHVQGRKAKNVAELFDWVDSVDSVEIAQKLSVAAQNLNKRLHVLFEVNLSREVSRFGFDLAGWEKDKKKLDAFIAKAKSIVTLSSLVVEGLMTMPPYVKRAEDNRNIFRSMKTLSKVVSEKVPDVGTHLSMGTSSDFEVAIEEGATMVRIGEALFGTRNATKNL